MLGDGIIVSKVSYQSIIVCEDVRVRYSWIFLQQIDHLDKAYLEQKGELATLQERLDDLARAR